jgi:short-subunit dehydrogenase
VVTGAARGLGAEIAAQVAGAGCRICRGARANRDRARVLDVTDPDACRALAREVRPHVWVNNAGVLGPGDAATQPDEVLERVVAVNVLGVMHGTRAAVEVMRERDGGRGEGHVITVGSLASWVPVPGETVYGATKAAALSFTLGLLGELRAAGASGVRLSVLCPDGMLTPMITETLHEDAVALSFSGTRLVTVQEVAARAVRLLERPRPIASVPRWRGLVLVRARLVPRACRSSPRWQASRPMCARRCDGAGSAATPSAATSAWGPLTGGAGVQPGRRLRGGDSRAGGARRPQTAAATAVGLKSRYRRRIGHGGRREVLLLLLVHRSPWPRAGASPSLPTVAGAAPATPGVLARSPEAGEGAKVRQRSGVARTRTTQRPDQHQAV